MLAVDEKESPQALLPACAVDVYSDQQSLQIYLLRRASSPQSTPSSCKVRECGSGGANHPMQSSVAIWSQVEFESLVTTMPALRALKKPAAKPLVHKKKHEKPAAKPSVHQKRENQVAGQRKTHQKREKTYQDKQTQTEKEPKTSGSEVMGQRQKVAVLPALLSPTPPPGGGPPPLAGAIFPAAYAGAGAAGFLTAPTASTI